MVEKSLELPVFLFSHLPREHWELQPPEEGKGQAPRVWCSALYKQRGSRHPKLVRLDLSTTHTYPGRQRDSCQLNRHTHPETALFQATNFSTDPAPYVCAVMIVGFLFLVLRNWQPWLPGQLLLCSVRNFKTGLFFTSMHLKKIPEEHHLKRW